MQSDKPGSQNPLTMMMREAFDSLLRTMMVCLPGKVLSFNPDDQTAQVECGIQRVISGRGVTIPVIENVPVQFSGDGQWYFWHQVKPGTEGLIHFSQRAIDTWLDHGGPAKPHDTRMFSAEDAFFVPGLRSRQGVIPGFDNSGVGLSSYDGATRVHLTDGAITLSAGGQTLTLDSSGLHHNNTNVGDTHTHPQDVDSGGDSQQDTGTPK